MGDVVGAVDRYTDIPAPVRDRLKARMERRDFDDLVRIRRDSIEGSQHYDPTIRDMYFGNGAVCRGVTRTAWAANAEERGLVYCEAGYCVLVPTVCRNVSRISRAEPPLAADPGAGGPEIAYAPPEAGGGTTPTFANSAQPGGGGSSGGFVPGVPGAPPYLPNFPGIPGGFIPGGGDPVTPVPEASTWALWLAGLAGVVAAPWLQRRRVRTVPADRRRPDA